MSDARRRGVPGALATLVVLVLGLMVAVGLAVQASMSAGDAFELVAVAAGAALAVSAVGWLVLRALRRQPIGVQALAVALTALVATVAGVVAAAEAMFLSAHDLRVLLVVVVMSAAVAAGAALQFGRSIDRGTRHVERAGPPSGRRRARRATRWPAAPSELADPGPPTRRRSRPAWPSPASASGPSIRRGASSSPGCPTTCAARWPPSGPWPRRSTTASSTTPPPWPATTTRSARTPNG